jgi:hypothetical protein
MGANNNLQVRNGEMSKVTIQKKTITPVHTKYRVLPDFKTCIPLKTKSFEKVEIEMDEPEPEEPVQKEEIPQKEDHVIDLEPSEEGIDHQKYEEDEPLREEWAREYRAMMKAKNQGKRSVYIFTNEDLIRFLSRKFMDLLIQEGMEDEEPERGGLQERAIKRALISLGYKLTSRSVVTDEMIDEWDNTMDDLMWELEGPKIAKVCSPAIRRMKRVKAVLGELEQTVNFSKWDEAELFNLARERLQDEGLLPVFPEITLEVNDNEEMKTESSEGWIATIRKEKEFLEKEPPPELEEEISVKAPESEQMEEEEYVRHHQLLDSLLSHVTSVFTALKTRTFKRGSESVKDLEWKLDRLHAEVDELKGLIVQ